ncbi:DUF2267 domain-containing protein [Mycoplana ramosa]|uniref:DUF2267 domain-containing protein n=1 Tax=Mycoplana ramosa TaxID=40837 RepID=A0ABW3YX09_MYCRA
MNETHVAALDHTIQQTNRWLKALVNDYNFSDRHQAYNALRAVLHALRDRLTLEQAAHLGAQFPILVRGIYYEGWHLGSRSAPERQVDEFAARVAQDLPPQFPRDPVSVTKAVFDLLWRELDPGETAKIIDELPVPLRTLWPEAARRN